MSPTGIYGNSVSANFFNQPSKVGSLWEASEGTFDEAVLTRNAMLGMTNITSKIPYMVNPGNHEATCTEFDGPGNLLTTYLNNNTPNKTDGKATNYGTGLTYYSCPPSQRYDIIDHCNNICFQDLL